MPVETMGDEPVHVARGAVAIITNSRGQVLLHLRDDLAHIAWPAYWSLLGGGADGDESQLPPAEGVELRFVDSEQLEEVTIPPYIRDGIRRWLAMPAPFLGR